MRVLTMNKLIKPAVLIMNKLTYKGKFILIGIIVIIALTILTYQLANQSRNIALFSKKELDGVAYINPLVLVMNSIQNLRQLQQSPMNDPDKKNNINNAINNINSAMAATDQTQLIYGNELDPLNNWGTIKNTWSTMKNDSSYNFTLLTNLVSDIKNLIVTACDNSNLTLDPDINTYYTMDSYCNNIPNALEESALIRDIGTNAILAKNIDQKDREKLIIFNNLLVDFNKQQINNNLEKVILSTPQITPLLKSSKDNFLGKITHLSTVLQDSILNNTLNISYQDFSTQFSSLIEEGYKLENISSQILKELLNIRVSRYMNTLYFNMGVSTFSFILLAYLFIAIYNSIISSIRNLIEGTKKLAEGNLKTLIATDTKDELNQVAVSFNQMRNSLSDIVNELQIMVSRANQGDLSKRIDVSNQSGFGRELIDAVNLMCDTFQMVIKDVTFALDHLSTGDLTTKITYDYQGSFGELKTFMNMTTDSLEKLINNIKKNPQKQ